jgi:putative transposase
MVGTRGKQLALPFRTWGGRRKGAGRKPRRARAGVPHLRRPELKSRHPVHVTMKLKEGLPSLRCKSLARLVLDAFHAAKLRLGARLVHFTVQSNHLHLIVEAEDGRALSRAMQGLAIRIARRLNQRFERRGGVFSDRFHVRQLRTPLEVRRALIYVLHNHRHHHSGAGVPSRFDCMSSAPYFDGFATPALRWPPDAEVRRDDPPVASPTTWLLRVGWRHFGLLGSGDLPG